VEEYDGSAWSTGGSLITSLALGSNGGGGQQTQAEAFVAGGYNPSNLSTTQEYNQAPSFYNYQNCLRCFTGDTTEL
jgi:hypothetical protein